MNLLELLSAWHACNKENMPEEAKKLRFVIGTIVDQLVASVSPATGLKEAQEQPKTQESV